MTIETQDALQRLLDEAEVRRLILTFSRALDEQDWESYANTFAQDGVFEILGQRRVGRAEIAAGPARDLTRYEHTQHYSTNHWIDVDGDRAAASHHLLAIHVPDAARPGQHADMGGRYVCECRRTEEGWRFSEVRLEVWWSGGIEFGIEPAIAEAHDPG
jgi:uncharacterized protein (TIGR02246 family)